MHQGCIHEQGPTTPTIIGSTGKSAKTRAALKIERHAALKCHVCHVVSKYPTADVCTVARDTLFFPNVTPGPCVLSLQGKRQYETATCPARCKYLRPWALGYITPEF